MNPALRAIDTGTRFVPHVFDELVTDLVYAKLPSWHAVACYFDWRLHYAAVVNKHARPHAAARLLKMKGAVLTENGWVLPRGELNPRVIDAGTQLVTAAEVAEQARIDAETAQQQRDHEYAVLAEDMTVFRWQWLAVIEKSKQDRAALLAVEGNSQEREAYMVRWHGENAPRH